MAKYNDQVNYIGIFSYLATMVIYAANVKPYQTIQLDSLAPQTPAEVARRNGFGYEVTAEYTVPNDMDSGIYYFGKP